jgi:hypothetical protein
MIERGLLAVAVSAVAALGIPQDAEAVRFALGLATDFTPFVIERRAEADDAGHRLRLGLRPILDVEVAPFLSFSAHAPFTLLRTGERQGAASSGAESTFALGASGRYRELDATGNRESLWYATLRGGFTTVDGRAGPYAGAAAGYAFTWLDTGRGVFVEVDFGRVNVDSPESGVFVDRWLFGLSAGVVFRLGGSRWDL